VPRKWMMLVVRYHLRVTLLAGAVAAGPLLGLGIGLHHTGLMIAAVIGGTGSSASAISWDSALQEHIPQNKLSRVASIDDLLSYAAIPLGQLAAGPPASRIGAPNVCLIAALIWITAGLVPLLNRSVRNLKTREPCRSDVDS